ncbi:hypothetical protein HMH01_04560 [Halovulum dunhuangense]|uniref:Sulfotransferase family protein n=1 Tax=Halovulum dunhuangense TaxID=1505036 RepID=A0A849L0B1_9RHOB|nr:hypothetical protein [Halovulum dunhuangense]NNU79708.1 hypothetical protein [Halovulum dunhuangense]
MTRVVVHAGFHKTGTSSLQRCLQKNRKALSSRILYVRRTDINRAAQTAALVARRPSALTRLLFRWQLVRGLRSLPGPEGRTVVISAERLSGLMPGRKGAWSFAVAPELAVETLRAVRAVWGADADVTFVYTTRKRDAWINSAWRHQVKHDGLAIPFEQFAGRTAGIPDMDALVARISARIAPVPVLTAPLEIHGPRRLGPVEAVLDLIGLPDPERAALRPGPQANVGLSHAEAEALVASRVAAA